MINYEQELNPAQLEAVTTTEGPLLVIAGAGSGKTRTIVYRLARLVEMGISPDSILLLTFTRKSSLEMLYRAGELLDMGLRRVSGGTFHGFCFSALRPYSSELGFANGFGIIDRSDSESIVAEARQDLKVAKGDKSFPKKGTMLGLISKARNTEVPLEKLLDEESPHLRDFGSDMLRIAERYHALKHKYAVMDYDDLLFRFDNLLCEEESIRNCLRSRYEYIMVDEYQDTNLVQARIVKQLSGSEGNIMAVGDDAQSIYAFRGANVRNILDFKDTFKNVKTVKLEQNYRSVQPVLALTNNILKFSEEKIAKKLFSDLKSDQKPEMFRSLSDLSQASLVFRKILELNKKYDLHEIAVLFRSGYHSYPLEVELNKIGIDYQKFGGMKFSEAAHVKDVLAFMRLAVNFADLPAWKRALDHVKGVGPKTCERIYDAFASASEDYVNNLRRKNSDLDSVLNMLDSLRSMPPQPKAVLSQVLEFYQPIMEKKYADDYPRRAAGLEQMVQIASGYDQLDAFLGDMFIENPESLGREGVKKDHLVLSTVHSAKGLEWDAVLIIDLVEERFPSKHSLSSAKEFEEERRLMYVACTRARKYLGMFVPDTIYNRYSGSGMPAMPSPFVQNLEDGMYEEFREGYSGGLTRVRKNKKTLFASASPAGSLKETRSAPGLASKAKTGGSGFCSHKIFGRGKIIGFVPPNKYRINFSGFGVKVILQDYITLE